jgi:hypothetical protein
VINPIARIAANAAIDRRGLVNRSSGVELCRRIANTSLSWAICYLDPPLTGL